MVNGSARHWGLLLFRGIVAIAFGVLSLLWPQLTLAVLVGFFAAYALLDGVGALMMAFRAHSDRGKLGLVLEGVLGIAAAVVAILYPGLTAVTLLVLIAAWAIFTGITAIVATTLVERELGAGGSPVLGMLSLLLGLALLVQPFAGALAVAWMVAVYAVVSGVIYVMLALRSRRALRVARAA
jgi:uncharacterized membrane protein HdeD (DUF308 family)